MKTIPSLCAACLIATGSLGQSEPAPLSVKSQAIIQKPLDEFIMYQFPVATGMGNTTFLFPGKIDGLYSSKASLPDNPNAQAEFLLDFQPGSYYFTVRALHLQAQDVITVIYDHKPYLLRIEGSKHPNYNVTFFHQDRRSGKGVNRPVTSTRLVSLVDKAKAYHMLSKEHPEALSGVRYAKPHKTSFYPDYKISVDEVFRFEEEDTLVFKLLIKNESNSTLYYQPDNVSIALKDQVFSLSLADASGIMPPQSVTSAYLAITGTAYGGRNHLAPNNPWNVLLLAEANPHSPTRYSKSDGRRVGGKAYDFKEVVP